MTIQQFIAKCMRSTMAHVSCSFVLMGSWAFFANMAHPMPKPLIAAILQGALSGVITLIMKKALERVFSYWVSKGQPKAGLFATPLTVCTVSASSLLACHAIAGTPELIATILVPSSVALFYAFVYTFALSKQVAAETV